ncbi:MAG: HoxN/HupN/NixA family nickel/cobalt transporter [Actinobacteria bacterium]|nr:HoxN/HupN/NixA family nickel/cobalt transporter [Actinomycetota bacterium]MBO0834908.1 HoxN/HupN/NixA family nickel/cobalt transporter [Actinomycetota bacterium]
MVTASRPRLAARLRNSLAALTPAERRRVYGMYGSILAMHLVGFTIFIAFVVPAHYKGLGIGVSVLAYTLGLRHAFDADHIAAIDNATRKELTARQGTGKPRPFCFGYFFSLGHSTIVVAMGIAIVVAEKLVMGQLLDSGSALQRFGTLFGTLISAIFLFLIGSVNLVILAGIMRVFRSMRRGEYDESELERQLDNRGFLYRIFGRWARAISKDWQLYPVGALFGLGFDTTTEVLLLGTTAFLALQHIPWYAICCLPVLFTAGMTIMDTTDGIFMNLAYGWAFFNPVRKVYYNLAITSLSVSICFLVGGIEALGLVSNEVTGLRGAGGFWGFIRNVNINVAGFVIVGLFVVTWVAAAAIWRYGHIEERWAARLRVDGAVTERG